MKQIMNRTLALMMALVMCVSLLSGLCFAGSAVTVSYNTGNADGFQNVIMNWGKRGVNATFLSQNAEAFYSDNNTSYSELAALTGSSNVNKVPSSALYRELAELMEDNHTTITSYADTRDLYRFTDCQNGKNNAISSFYSGVTIGPKWDGGSTWNREHTWPNSKGMNGNDENDIMMLRPTSSSENSARGNKAYGESAGFYDPDALSNGVYHLRGDVARTMLYVYVRWGNTAIWGSDGVIENLDILLKWVEEDPVDTWELGRNDSVESITGTRNVFVDYPELVFVLFDAQIPTDMVTPSGEAVNGGNTYSITAVSNNAAYGTVSVSGKNINAKPADGYIVAGYTILSGTATVKRDGNVFTVSASSDCQIQIDFEPRATGAVSFYQDGVEIFSQDVYINDAITLPSHSGAVVDGYSFLGWVTATVSETTVAPTKLYTAGTSYTVVDDVTFHALYSRVDSTGSGESSVYNAYVGVPVEGDYLIVSDGAALKASVSSKGRFDYTEITVTDNTIMNPTADIIWHIAPSGNGTFTIYNKDAAAYAGGSGVANKGKLLDTVNEYAQWAISADQIFENVGNRSKGVNYTLRRNATYGFACYASGTGTGMTLYKMASGTVYYSTTAGQSCPHINTTEIAAQQPDCTTAGYTAGVYCDDCRSYISGHEKVEALGHSYDSVVTAPTETEPGFTTYTCSTCGDIYVGDHTEALGKVYQVEFVVPFGVTDIENAQCGKAGIKLPTADAPAGEYVYTFVGWVEQNVNNSEIKPSVYTAGSTFNTESNVTLYALYSYAPGGAGTGAWELITDDSALTAGAELVLASNVQGAVAGQVNGKYLTSVTAEFSADFSVIKTLPADAVIFTLGGTKDAWTLTNADGNLLGSVAAKNVGWDKGTSTWSIAFDENGDAIVLNGTDTFGRFLYNVQSPRFCTYTSDTHSSMLLPQLYKRDGAVGPVYYTTVFNTMPDIGADGNIMVSGTITSAGNTEDDVTLELLKDGSVAYSTVVTGNSAHYILSDVAPGSYTLRISKSNHVTREYAVTAGSINVTQNVEICLLGDVTGDGRVNMKDWSTLYEHVNEQTILTDYPFSCADVNLDGRVNMKDWNRLYGHISETDPLW